MNEIQELALKLKTNRSKKAFSLVTVLCSGLIGAMTIGAAYSMLVPLMQQSSAGKQSYIMRTIAETAIEFVSLDIGSCFGTAQSSKYDDPELGFPYNTFELTPAQLGIEDSNNKSVRLAVTVKNEFPMSENESAMYDFQTVPSNDSKKQWSMAQAKYSGWRIIEVRVGIGSSASAKAIYRAIMQPHYPDLSYLPITAGNDPNKAPYFPIKDTAISTTAMNIGANTNITGNLSTNGSRFGSAPLNISGSGITIKGNISVNSLAPGSDDLVALGSAPSSGTESKVTGFVSTNGEILGFNDTGALDHSQITVERPLPGAPNFNSDPAADLTPTKGSDPQTNVAPAPTAPTNSTDLGSINLSGDAKLVIQDGPVNIPTGQSLSNMTSGTASIPPGDYKISSMSVADSASIQVADGSSLSQPASFYIDNLSGGDSAVNIGGSGVSNPTSGNFQVWYNGTNNVTLSGGQATMAVYAPNAKITIGGKGSPIIFKGALLGNSVAVSNATLTFETPAASTKSGSSSGQMMYEVTSENGKVLIKPDRLKRVLWQELSYSDFIKQGNAPF